MNNTNTKHHAERVMERSWNAHGKVIKRIVQNASTDLGDVSVNAEGEEFRNQILMATAAEAQVITSKSL